MPNSGRALVLGGGGPVGVGWEAGLIAGLESAGAAVTDAGLIAGTSAGAIIGAQLALGRPPRELYEVQLALGDGTQRPSMRTLERPGAVRELTERLAAWYTSGRPPDEIRREIGAFALEADTPSEDEWLESFGSLETFSAAWPERPFVCTAVDTADGAFVTWDRDSGVDLGRAVASSCAVPGVYPPITINGRRYMDGGMRSSTNADLAAGYAIVLVVAVTPAVAVGPRGDAVRRRLDGELAALREAGSTVALIAPDEASREAFGRNLLDTSRRRAAAEAGYRQGRAEASRVRDVWMRVRTQ